MQKVLTAEYADFDIAVDDIMVAIKDMQEKLGDPVHRKMIQLARNYRPVSLPQITQKEVRDVIDYRLRATPVGSQIRQLEVSAKELDRLNAISKQNMALIGELSDKQMRLMRDMNEIAVELDQKDDEKLSEDRAMLNAGIQPPPANPLIRPQAHANEAEGEGEGDEAEEVAGDEAAIEAAEAGGVAGAGNVAAAPEQPETEETLKAAWVAKKKERIQDLEWQIKQLDKLQKFVHRGVQKNMQVLKGKREIFK